MDDRWPPGRECLRWAKIGTSFNHEVRRAGGLEEGGMIFCACATWSPSSSEEANASESGVERRTPGFVFSRMAEAVAAAGGVDDGAMEIGLLDGADMVYYHKKAHCDKVSFGPPI